MNATAGIRTRVTSVAGTYHTTKLLSHKNDILIFCICCEQSERVRLYAGQRASLAKAVMGPPGLSKHLRA